MPRKCDRHETAQVKRMPRTREIVTRACGVNLNCVLSTVLCRVDTRAARTRVCDPVWRRQSSHEAPCLVHSERPEECSSSAGIACPKAYGPRS